LAGKSPNIRLYLVYIYTLLANLVHLNVCTHKHTRTREGAARWPFNLLSWEGGKAHLIQTFICTNIHICMHMCTCVCVIFLHVRKHTHGHTNSHVHTHARTHTRIRTHTRAHTRVHTRAHTNTHTRTHTCTHTHAHVAGTRGAVRQGQAPQV